jgi:hypothetical protein
MLDNVFRILKAGLGFTGLVLAGVMGSRFAGRLR